MRVVSGALIREGRVLMGLRKSTGMRPDLWELPGGKVEATRLTSSCDFVGDAGCINERCLRCHPTREAFMDDLAEWTVKCGKN